MLISCIALLLASAQGAETRIELGDEAGYLYVPSTRDIAVEFRGYKPGESVTWTNPKEASRLKIFCGDNIAHEETREEHEVAVLKVGKMRHELASGAMFEITCPEGMYANVVDQRGLSLVSTEGPIRLTVTRVDKREEVGLR